MTPTIQAVPAMVAPQGSGHSDVAADPPQPIPLRAAAAEQAAAIGLAPASVEEALPWLRQAAERAGVDLSFRVDAESDRVVVSVTDRRDGTVLRQIPSEEALRIASHLQKNGGSGGGLVAAVV